MRRTGKQGRREGREGGKEKELKRQISIGKEEPKDLSSLCLECEPAVFFHVRISTHSSSSGSSVIYRKPAVGPESSSVQYLLTVSDAHVM